MPGQKPTREKALRERGPARVAGLRRREEAGPFGQKRERGHFPF